MVSHVIELLMYLSVGAIVGVVLLKVAPVACKRFHDFSVSTRSIPLHCFGVAMFACCGIMGIVQHNYFIAALGCGMMVLSISALFVVQRVAIKEAEQRKQYDW